MTGRMELRQLRYFVAVAKELNFTRAAARLRVAQPALSRQVRRLEEELGAALFERSPRGARLTEAGATFLREAEALLEQSDRAMRAVRTASSAAPPILEVGYVWGLFHSRVPEWIARHRREHPDIRVNLFDFSATEQAAALVEERLDLGFIGLAYEADAAGLAKRRVATCSWMAVLPERHPAARQRRVRLASLAQEFFLAISDRHYPGAAHLMDDACRRAGFRPRILQSAERGYTLLGMVAAGCGLTLLPDSLQALPHPVVVFRPLQDAPPLDLHVAWNRARRSPTRDAWLASLGEA